LIILREVVGKPNGNISLSSNDFIFSSIIFSY
jgi:hypothetical protein